MTFEIDINKVKVNRHAKYLGQGHVAQTDSYKMISQNIYKVTQRHTHQAVCSTRTTKGVGRDTDMYSESIGGRVLVQRNWD